MLKKLKIDQIAAKFLNGDIVNDNLSNPRFWAQQNKIYVKLYKIYPSDEFWHSFSLGFKVPSLAYFLTPKGAKILDDTYISGNYTENNLDAKNILTKQDSSPIIKKPRFITDL